MMRTVANDDHRNPGTGRSDPVVRICNARTAIAVPRSPYADFFFAFGLVAFGMTGASGVPSIEDRRPAVKV